MGNSAEQTLFPYPRQTNRPVMMKYDDPNPPNIVHASAAIQLSIRNYTHRDVHIMCYDGKVLIAPKSTTADRRLNGNVVIYITSYQQHGNKQARTAHGISYPTRQYFISPMELEDTAYYLADANIALAYDMHANKLSEVMPSGSPVVNRAILNHLNDDHCGAYPIGIVSNICQADVKYITVMLYGRPVRVKNLCLPHKEEGIDFLLPSYVENDAGDEILEVNSVHVDIAGKCISADKYDVPGLEESIVLGHNRQSVIALYTETQKISYHKRYRLDKESIKADIHREYEGTVESLNNKVSELERKLKIATTDLDIARTELRQYTDGVASIVKTEKAQMELEATKVAHSTTMVRAHHDIQKLDAEQLLNKEKRKLTKELSKQKQNSDKLINKHKETVAELSSKTAEATSTAANMKAAAVIIPLAIVAGKSLMAATAAGSGIVAVANLVKNLRSGKCIVHKKLLKQAYSMVKSVGSMMIRGVKRIWNALTGWVPRLLSTF